MRVHLSFLADTIEGEILQNLLPVFSPSVLFQVHTLYTKPFHLSCFRIEGDIFLISLLVPFSVDVSLNMRPM